MAAVAAVFSSGRQAQKDPEPIDQFLDREADFGAAGKFRYRLVEIPNQIHGSGDVWLLEMLPEEQRVENPR